MLKFVIYINNHFAAKNAVFNHKLQFGKFILVFMVTLCQKYKNKTINLFVPTKIEISIHENSIIVFLNINAAISQSTN